MKLWGCASRTILLSDVMEARGGDNNSGAQWMNVALPFIYAGFSTIQT